MKKNKKNKKKKEKDNKETKEKEKENENNKQEEEQLNNKEEKEKQLINEVNEKGGIITTNKFDINSIADIFTDADIEELCKTGIKLTFCPFYQQIEIAKKSADIIFMPYNYM